MVNHRILFEGNSSHGKYLKKIINLIQKKLFSLSQVMARRFNFDETLESITPVRQMDLGIESLSLVTDLFSCGILRLYEEEDDATAEDRARKAENAVNNCIHYFSLVLFLSFSHS